MTCSIEDFGDSNSCMVCGSGCGDNGASCLINGRQASPASLVPPGVAPCANILRQEALLISAVDGWTRVFPSAIGAQPARVQSYDSFYCEVVGYSSREWGFLQVLQVRITL